MDPYHSDYLPEDLDAHWDPDPDLDDEAWAREQAEDDGEGSTLAA
ncbi:MAG: hypothetical protein M0Z49_14060 [Chloroflexi bacterium]|nr:hypothetical protein [Chloroflexota bacterium]